MNLNKFMFFCFVLAFSFQVKAQDADSILNYSTYIDKVLKNHPMNFMAELEVTAAKANLLKARGNFDPKIDYKYSEKRFGDLNYYSVHDGKLKVPTRLGPTFFMGYEDNSGAFLNPQQKLPTDGVGGVGVNIPLLRGLLIDEARLMFRQAKVLKDGSFVEKKLLLNQLILNATYQYWYWFEAYNNLKVYENGIRLAEERFLGVKQSAELGDLPAIDTLEAFVQLQTRYVDYYKVYAEYQMNELQLAFFLWEDDSLKAELNLDLPPHYESFDDFKLPLYNIDSIAYNIDAHPELNEKQMKLRTLGLDKKMAWENFKPQVDLVYQPLTELNDIYPDAEFIGNNYKYGVDVKVPLFFRKERGQLKAIKVYEEQTQLEIDQKRMQLYNKALGSLYELKALSKRLEAQKTNVENYLQLLESEKQKFSLGESSLFILNSRENKYLKEQTEYIKLLSKYQITNVKYLYYANEL